MKKILEVIVLENGDLGFGIQWSTLGHHKLLGKYNGIPLDITSCKVYTIEYTSTSQAARYIQWITLGHHKLQGKNNGVTLDITSCKVYTMEYPWTSQAASYDFEF